MFCDTTLILLRHDSIIQFFIEFQDWRKTVAKGAADIYASTLISFRTTIKTFPDHYFALIKDTDNSWIDFLECPVGFTFVRDVVHFLGLGEISYHDIISVNLTLPRDIFLIDKNNKWD